MLQKIISYTDFNGVKRERVAYFNLMKSELLELELSNQGGLTKLIEEIVKTDDSAKMVSLFKRVILLAYGEKDPDGEHFNKSPEISARFANSLAFSEFFMELAANTEAASAFFNGLVPAENTAG